MLASMLLVNIKIDTFDKIIKIYGANINACVYVPIRYLLHDMHNNNSTYVTCSMTLHLLQVAS